MPVPCTWVQSSVTTRNYRPQSLIRGPRHPRAPQSLICTRSRGAHHTHVTFPRGHLGQHPLMEHVQAQSRCPRPSAVQKSTCSVTQSQRHASPARPASPRARGQKEVAPMLSALLTGGGGTHSCR